MMPAPDRKEPADDRDEFMKRLGYINNWVITCGINNIMEALIDADPVKIAKIKSTKDAQLAYNENALRRYDNAKSRAERQAVVASIKQV